MNYLQLLPISSKCNTCSVQCSSIDASEKPSSHLNTMRNFILHADDDYDDTRQRRRLSSRKKSRLIVFNFFFGINLMSFLIKSKETQRRYLLHVLTAVVCKCCKISLSFLFNTLSGTLLIRCGR